MALFVNRGSDMALKELMTWDIDAKRWRKKVPSELVERLGKKYVAVSCRQLGTAPTKEASRAAANAWWMALESQAQSVEVAKPSLWEERRDAMAAWHRSEGEAEKALAVEEMDPKDLALGFTGREAWAIWEERLTPKKSPKVERLLSTRIQQFLDHKKNKTSIGHWDNMRRHCKLAQIFLGKDATIDDLNSQNLVAFHDYLENSILGEYTKRDTMVTFKSLISDTCELDLIPVPGKLMSKSLGFSVDAAEIEIFEIPELKNIYNHAVDRTKLFLLLAMNCGFTQIDISDLTHSEVDLKAGTITRQRSKTRKGKKVNKRTLPTVTWKLWPNTLKLLRQFATKPNAARVLLTEEGNVLKQDTLTGEIRIVSDLIRSAYIRTLDVAKIPKEDRKGFSAIRATGASLLGSHPEFTTYAQYFLSHKARSVVDKHYKKPSQVRFDAAVKWLGEQYGF